MSIKRWRPRLPPRRLVVVVVVCGDPRRLRAPPGPHSALAARVCGGRSGSGPPSLNPRGLHLSPPRDLGRARLFAVGGLVRALPRRTRRIPITFAPRKHSPPFSPKGGEGGASSPGAISFLCRSQLVDIRIFFFKIIQVIVCPRGAACAAGIPGSACRSYPWPRTGRRTRSGTPAAMPGRTVYRTATLQSRTKAGIILPKGGEYRGKTSSDPALPGVQAPLSRDMAPGTALVLVGGAAPDRIRAGADVPGLVSPGTHTAGRQLPHVQSRERSVESRYLTERGRTCGKVCGESRAHRGPLSRPRVLVKLALLAYPL